MSTHLRLALAFGILSSIPLPARADVIIFSNLIGPCCGGYGLFGSDFLGSNSMAEAFTPEVTIPLSAAQVVVFSDAPSDRHFNISLFSDISGLPGTLIEQIGSELLAPPGIGGIVSASSHLMPTLKSGTQYWLVLTPFSTSTTIAWEQGPGPTVPFAGTSSTTGEGGWGRSLDQTLQFRIIGAVPEPASLLLTCSALIVLLRKVANG